MAIVNQAQALGLTAAAYQDLQAVAKENQIEQGQFEQLISRFTVELADGAKKAGDAAKKAGKDVRQFGDDVFNTGVKITSLAKGFTDKDRAEKAAKKTTDDTTLSLKNLGVTTTENGEALIAYAKRIASIEDPLQRLAIVSADFGRKQAVAVIPFLLAINDNIAETGRIAGDAVPALSELELAVGLKLEAALSKLGTTVDRTKLRLQLLFAGPVEQGVAAFDDLIRRNQATLQEFVQTIVNTAVPVIQDLINAFAGRDADVQDPGILRLRDNMLQFAADLRVITTELIIPAFQLIVEGARLVADAINGIAGTEITAGQVLIVAALGKILGIFRLLGSVVKETWLLLKLFWDTFKLGSVAATVMRSLFSVLVQGAAALATFVAGLIGLPALVVAGIVTAIAAAGVAIFVFWDEIKAAAKAAFDFIAVAGPLAWEALKEGAVAVLDGILAALGTSREQMGTAFDDVAARIGSALSKAVDQAKGVADAIRDAISGAADALKSIWTKAVDSVLDALNDLKAGALRILDNIKDAAVAAARAIARAFKAADDAPSGSSGGSAPGLAAGGAVRGPGTGTSDSVLAWLSNGEFVLRAAAVRKYGLRWLWALNSLRLPKELMGFADGGLIGDFARSMTRVSAPSFASGGLVNVGPSGPSGTPFQLVLPSGHVIGGLSASPDAVEQLSRYAMRRQMTSGGQKPSWYGA